MGKDRDKSNELIRNLRFYTESPLTQLMARSALARENRKDGQ